MADRFTQKHKKLFGILAIVIAIIFSAAVFFFLGKPLISLVSKPKVFRDWVNNFGIWGRLIFVGMIILQVIVAIIPGEPFEIAAGYAFGAIEGTILCLVGAIIGSALIFLLVRRFGIMLVEVFFSKEKIDS
ncbi:MAG: TVP38/TMEM64 family protein, partial [Oscillospiraceae bacterium]|nr:TVP38/TMEM64 family protein [Oscillospiraceae bacterium]